MKEQVNQAIKDMVAGNLNQMTETLNSVLISKAAAKLDEKKIEIAQNYFGQK